MMRIYEKIGDYYCMEGKLEKAVEFWEKAVKAKERSVIKWQDRVRWNFWTGVKDWAERHGFRRLVGLAVRSRG